LWEENYKSLNYQFCFFPLSTQLPHIYHILHLAPSIGHLFYFPLSFRFGPICLQFLLMRRFNINSVATPLWQSVGVQPNTPKVGDLESSGTPECLEFNRKAQNTLHWGVLGVIGKVLKRRYRKWPRIGHLDICSPSYGQKKGRESNWQFDSRPLKVKNRPLPDVRIESATRR